MKNKLINIFLCLTFFLGFLNGPTKVEKKKSDYFTIELKDYQKDSIKILQVTDLHIGSEGKWNDDLNTFKRIKRLIEMYEPNVLFVTGDLFTGAKPYGSLLTAFAVHFFDNLKIPWLYVFGNHDPEGGFGHDDIYEIFNKSEWGILGFHNSENSKKYDYLVDIKISGKDNPIWQIYAFDTGPHNGIKAVQPDQIAWYKNTSLQSQTSYKEIIPAISIFHIPLIQYQELWNDSKITKKGVSLEKVYYEEDDGSLYNAFVEMKNVKYTFCGHDHYNNYWGKTKDGITLAYGYISGESTKEAWPTGGKLISIPINGGDIFIKNITPKFDSNEHKY
ncbi:MAG: metallophosphoesterase family protein [Ignavibacteriales bacterium]|nr:metallophosphoesterase family protein [Ignavibacteriales bacterium]MCB9208747.1 metallophosphoesterase family protein [Ignavibacteriales bacterium]MCB9218335.1 metallophosphoesterase family protein [Ignavibacteriales bacterium]